MVTPVNGFDRTARQTRRSDAAEARLSFLGGRIRATRLQALVSLALVFGCGAALGFGLARGGGPESVPVVGQAMALAPSDEPVWLDDVAASHRIFAKQDKHLAELAPSAAESAVSWLSASIGINFMLPDLSAEGLEFKGARLIVAAGKPTAQLFYRNGEGETFAICVLKAGTSAEIAGSDETIRDDVGMVFWQKGEAAYVLTGPSSDAALDKLAGKVSGLI